MHRFDTALADVEAKSDSRAIRTALNEWQQQLIGLSFGKPTAMILDFNRDSGFRRLRAEPDFCMANCELESIVQQIGYRRGKHLGVGINHDVVFDGRYPEPAFARPRIKRRCGFDFTQEPGQANGLQARRQASVAM